MVKKSNTHLAGLFFSLCCILADTTTVQAATADCSDQTVPAIFLTDKSLLCLQKIVIEEQNESSSYSASLTWAGPDSPSQFRLLTTSPDDASIPNSPSFSTTNGTLTLPKIDIPSTFGTERYHVNLILLDGLEPLFELSSLAVYINPDFIPNLTWKPYGMLDRDERYAVDLLGRSLPYAKLADAVYDFDHVTIDQWILFETKDKSSGMQAAVYYNQDTDEIALAFRGTESCNFPCSPSESAEFLRDSTTDALLAVGQANSQFKDAMNYAQDVVNRAQGRKIVVTGHSLGGSLAQAIGSALGLETFAFNSAPVPDEFLDDYPSALPPESLNEIIHVLSDIFDPVANGNFYQDADHISPLIQFDFERKEILPAALKQSDLSFDNHSITQLVDNANQLLTIYRDGW